MTKEDTAARHKEYMKLYNKEYRAKNLDKLKAARKQYYLANKPTEKESLAKWREDNKDREKAVAKEWRKNNPDKYKATCKGVRLRKKRLIGGQALSKLYSKEIKKIYANCPPGYHVDHRVPLRGKKVSGLHVPWNLQYLPAADNIKKSNEFDVITG